MAKLRNFTGTAGMNAGTNYYAHNMRVSDISEDEELESLIKFSIDEELVKTISQSMLREGYHGEEPIVVWEERGVIVEGRTRLRAAKEAELVEVPVVKKSFESVDEAALYVFERQANRRNLTQGEILTIAATLENKLRRDSSGRGAEILAKRLGIGKSTVYKARAVNTGAAEEDIEAIKQGKSSINEVYNKVKNKPQSTPKADFYSADKDGEIDSDDDFEGNAFPIVDNDTDDNLDPLSFVQDGNGDTCMPNEGCTEKSDGLSIENAIILLNEAEEDTDIREAKNNDKIVEAIDILIAIQKAA